VHNGECGHVAVRPPGYVHVAGQPGGHELGSIYRKRIPKGSPVIVRLQLVPSCEEYWHIGRCSEMFVPASFGVPAVFVRDSGVCY
jgi:hypothetical protein